MTYIFFIYSSDEENISCFHFLDIVSILAVNMSEGITVEVAIESFGYMPKSGWYTHSYGNLTFGEVST